MSGRPLTDSQRRGLVNEILAEERRQAVRDMELLLEEVFELARYGMPGNPRYRLLQAVKDAFPADPDSPSKKKRRPIPHRLRWEVFKRDGFLCQHCGTQDDLAADHIIPDSRGGPTTLENLQTLCRSCNSRKGAKV